MRVVTYSRCSTSHHDQNPDIQVRQLRQFVKDRNWELTEEIIDHGFSGGTDRRPGLNRLLELCRSKKVDAVVITKLDRLFRSLKMLVSTLDEFQYLGITFISITDVLDYSSASGRMVLQIMGSLAEFERSLVRERTLAGLKYAKEVKGKRLGAPERFSKELIIKLGEQGLSYPEICKLVGCSEATVSRHLRRQVSKWKS
jgi:putative DNA-invertase from lambdoid prophage Rac